MRRTRCSAAAREAARLMAVVVLPTPPFWLASERTLPMFHVEPSHAPKDVEVIRVASGKLVTDVRLESRNLRGFCAPGKQGHGRPLRQVTFQQGDPLFGSADGA